MFSHTVSLSVPRYSDNSGYLHFTDEGAKSKRVTGLVQFDGGVNSRDNIQTGCSDFNTHTFGIWGF